VLNNVSITMNRLARNVVMNHPNSWGCQVFRKVYKRSAPETVAGAPTMGGLAVLDSMDEEDFTYKHIGNGCALRAEGFAPAPMMKRGDANIGAGDEIRFLVEPEEPAGHPDWFDLRNHDVMLIWLGADPDCAKLAFECVGIETTSDIPPYTTRYIMNRRDDLHIAAGA